MLNFETDKRNMTNEELRHKNKLLLQELKALGEKAEKRADNFTSDDSRRVAEISDWIDAAKAPADRSGHSSMDGGFNLPSASDSERRSKDLAYGQFFQAVAAAASPVGNRYGQFETGRIYRNVLEPETRVTGMGESIPSEGGFLVGTTFSEDIIGSLYSPDKLPGMVRKTTLTGNTNKLSQPGFDETSRANGSRWGGIQSFYESEGGEKTASKPKFRKIEMSLVKLIGLCYASDEIIEDAARLGQYIREGFQQEINFKVANSILNGSGSGQPLGIVNSGALVTCDAAEGQTSDTIIWDNILAMLARYRPMNPGQGIWVTNQDCLPQLLSMSMAIGTGGVPVYTPAQAPGGAGSLAGMRVLFSEAAPTLGDKMDLLLMDPRSYLLVDKAGVQIATSIHVKFIYDEQVFRFVYRHNGQPMFAAPITPFKGSATVSPFVCIEERA